MHQTYLGIQVCLFLLVRQCVPRWANEISEDDARGQERFPSTYQERRIFGVVQVLARASGDA